MSKTAEVSINGTIYPECGLGWRYLNKQPVQRLAGLPVTLASRFPTVVPVIAAVIIAGVAILAATREQAGESIQQGVNPVGVSEQGQFADYGLPLPDRRSQYLQMAEALLTTSGLNLVESSFTAQMEAAGYEVGPLQPFASEVFIQAGRDGLLPRRFPTSDLRFIPVIPGIKPINWGEYFPVYGIVPVRTPAGITEYYGLGGPWRVTPVIPAGQTSAPNVIGGIQYEPTWFRLGERTGGDSLESFITPPTALLAWIDVSKQIH